VPNGKDVTFYDEAVKLFEKHKDANKNLLLKISKCQDEKGNLHYGKQEWVAAIKAFV